MKKAWIAGAVLLCGCGPETPKAGEPKTPAPSVAEARKKWHCTPGADFNAESAGSRVESHPWQEVLVL